MIVIRLLTIDNERDRRSVGDNIVKQFNKTLINKTASDMKKKRQTQNSSMNFESSSGRVEH